MYSLYVLRTAMRPASAATETSEASDIAAPEDVEVGLQAVPAALPAETGLLVPAERRGGIEPVERVRPDHPGPQPGRQPQDQRSLLRPDPGRQAIGGVVRLLDRLGRRAERQHGKHRPEDLLLRDAVRRGHPGKDRRREPEPAVRQGT